ncbi:MAG TPA: ribonuclease III [Candidatus Ventrimonas merdavium]|nr:ribonuclease III [Candidatus Ventrimonas merdavium]
MEDQMRAWMDQALQIGPVDARTYSPLALAYIGDAVYELLIRTRVVSRGSVQVNKMHKKSASLVKAEAQADLIKALMDELTEEELAVYKRGRNAKSVTMARHATMTDYRMATGLEALVGYLYLQGEYKRLLELVHDGLEKMGEFA